MTDNSIQLAGVDLAWVSDNNPTAIAYGVLDGNELIINGIVENLFGVDAIVDALSSLEDLHGIALDASLIINNVTGQRPCEREITRDYGSKKAGCHASNLTLYPDPDSVKISRRLERLGFNHCCGPDQPWMLECYPHPALIEIFGLVERHLYKKGPVEQRRSGQCELASMLLSLSASPVLKLLVPDSFRHYFDSERIRGLKGSALKHNEDVLDAVVCLYVAGLYQAGHPGKVYGGKEDGYVYVPGECGSSK